jgi:hypothetical protein
MKQKAILFFFGIVLFLCGVTVHSQQESLIPRVAIVPMVNETKDDQYDFLCITIDDTVKLALDLAKKFMVMKAVRFDPYKKAGRVKSYAEENRLDNIVFGKTYLNKMGEIIVRMSVYDRTRDRVAITKEEKASSIFEIFDASNRLVKALVKEFSDMHMGYGALKLVNTGEEGDFELYIDGELKGKNTGRVRNVLNGQRKIEIKQNRMFGTELIFTQDIWVYEAAVSQVDFAVPYLLQHEKEALEKVETSIAQSWDSREDTGKVVGSILEGYDLLKDISYCKGLEKEREKFRQVQCEYTIQLNKWRIDDNFTNFDRWAFFELVGLYDTSERFLDPERVQERCITNANYLYSTLSLNALHDFSMGNWENGFAHYDLINYLSGIIPAENYHQLEDEKSFVSNTKEEYLKRYERNRAFAEISIGNKLKYFYGDRLKSSFTVFKNFDRISGRELIILTNPSGMEVFVNEKSVGNSPVRMKRVSGKDLKIEVKDPWFEERTVIRTLDENRNYIFINSPCEARLKTSPVEEMGRKQFRLSWNELEGAESYSVQVDEINGDFTDPILEKDGLKKNTFDFQKEKKDEKNYKYRVQAVNSNNLKCDWAYGEIF